MGVYMDYFNDRRVVMTLDAGGTNFVFSAIQGNEEIIEPVALPSYGNDLDKCLKTIVNGFKEVKSQLKTKPIAISFAFPGPADYPRGVIGDLINLPGFRGGIALGPMLEEKFSLPVFINNDGNLFGYGEAIAGYLPFINNLLKESGSPKRYKNLIGLTLGTGFGASIVHDGKLIIGDNSSAGEAWLLRSKIYPTMNAEEGVSIRAIHRFYISETGIDVDEVPTPKEIYEIALGRLDGNKEAALEAYRKMGEALGEAIANIVTLIDGIVVIGGGISGAYSLFLPEVVKEMNSQFILFDGSRIPRLVVKTFNLEDEEELRRFINGDSKEITVPGSDRKMNYDPLSRIGIGISKIGTSKATGIGAYAFALSALDG